MLPPLSLYVHFPWCVRKCPYCDFNSHAARGPIEEAPYIAALLQDLSQEAAGAQGRALQSIFLGGGTPSLFSPRALEQLLAGVAGTLSLAADVEVTLEANPGTIERGRFAEYRAAGINRVSLGAQSFSDAQLQRLGRIHQAAETRRAAEELHAAGLENFNLDLMYALPGQTLAEACADVQAALELSPAHVSHYQLTLEPGTLFGAQPPAGLPEEDLAADMQEACVERLAAAGLARYEVAAFAHPGRRCRHNLNYWGFGDYLGIGAGAHGKCSWQGQSGPGRCAVLRIERSSKWREPRRYLHSLPAQRHVVPAADLPFEYLMNALRLTDGFETEQFELRTGLALEVIAPRLAALAARGLLSERERRWWPTARGLALLNELLGEFLPTAPLLV